MPRTKPAEQRRADLLAAGEALFVTKGIAATTLEDITGRAGVSKGLFYLYFRSKEDLVVALRNQFSREFATRVRAAADAEPDWAAKLDAIAVASYRCYQELHELHEVLFHHGGHEHGPKHGQSGEHGEHGPDGPRRTGGGDPAGRGGPDGEEPEMLAHTLATILAEGVAAGALRVPDPEATAVLFYVTMHAFDPEFQDDYPLTGDRLIHATQRLFRSTTGLPA